MAQETKKLYLSRNKQLAGVCGGIAEYFDIDPTIVRIIFVLMVFFAVGSPLLVYIVLWIVMSDRPEVNEYAFTDEFERNKDEYSYDEDEYKI